MKIASGRDMVDFELDKPDKSYPRRFAAACEVLVCPPKINRGTLGFYFAALALAFPHLSLALTFSFFIISAALVYRD